MIHHLRDSMDILKKENEKLRNHLRSIIGRKNTETMVVQECFATRTEKLVLSLRKAENRVCDANTIAFLQLLQTEVKSIKNK
jgi:FtsZ-binding cell division protein ZapB